MDGVQENGRESGSSFTTGRPDLTEAGRERLRAAALANRPWLHSTGPRTAEGKRVCSRNGRGRQAGERSVRELRRELAVVAESVASLARAKGAALAARRGP